MSQPPVAEADDDDDEDEDDDDDDDGRALSPRKKIAANPFPVQKDKIKFH